MGRNDRCPGVPRSASPAMIWQKIDKGVTCLLGVSCAVRRYFAGRLVRRSIIGAGHDLVPRSTVHSRERTVRGGRSPRLARRHTRRHAHRLDRHRARRRTPSRRVRTPVHPRAHRPLPAATRRAAHLPRTAALLLLHAAGWTRSPFSGSRVDQGGDDSVRADHRPTPRTRAPDVRSTATPPASRPRTPLGGSPVYSAAQPDAVPRRVLTGGVIHLGHVLRTERTAPGTPASAPPPGSSESDRSPRKAPSGPSDDLPWLSLLAPGLWSVAFRQTTRVGRPIADEPSFSPD